MARPRTPKITIKNVTITPRNYLVIKLAYGLFEWIFKRTSSVSMTLLWSNCTLKDLTLYRQSNNPLEKFWIREMEKANGKE